MKERSYFENIGQDNITNFDPPQPFPPGKVYRSEDPRNTIRTFKTGATRDTSAGKLEYIGFLSARVLKRFAQYMDENRLQKDGSLRSADNWKKGIPKRAYLDSLTRHLMDLLFYVEHLGFDGSPYIEDLLCAIMFNSMGLLYEVTR